MRLPVKTIALAASLALLALAPSLWTDTAGAGSDRVAGEPHDFGAYGMNCRSCHTSVGVKTSGGMVKPVNDICRECHNLAGYLSHPVNIRPSFAVPAGLPLDEQGMMTCATCHDPHKSYRNPWSGEKTMYLRREGPKKSFCGACHRDA